MFWLIGDWSHLGEVAAKAVLMYATAMVALRLGERRTLAQWTIIDFATAVAMGAIIGRTAIAKSESFITGAVAVVALVAVHRLVSALRFTRPVAKLVDHRVRVLVDHGEVRLGQLRKCAITQNDLYAHLRQQGYFNLESIRYVLYETKGGLTVVPDDDRPAADEPLVAAGIDRSAGYP
ncbi:MAG TPA: YetF domain-containing protein [Acidothermaceae bacterium]|nr:YetF domain-containing protein [Acidothermaceae bacterium]